MIGQIEFQTNSQTDMKSLGNNLIFLSYEANSCQGQKQGIVKDKGFKKNHSLRENYVSWSQRNK